jgi:hypothetical protein
MAGPFTLSSPHCAAVPYSPGDYLVELNKEERIQDQPGVIGPVDAGKL